MFLTYLKILYYGFYRTVEEIISLWNTHSATRKHYPVLQLCVPSHISCGCLIWRGPDPMLGTHGVIPDNQEAQISARRSRQNKTNKKSNRNHSRQALLKKRLQRILVQSGVFSQYQSVREGCALQGFPSSVSVLDIRLKTCAGSFYLLWDWWLDWRTKQRRQVLSSTPRGKAMFHKTTHSLLRINLH